MTSRVTEAVKLYTPRQVGMAAFLGTPLGGAVLIALNYVRLGNRKGARMAIVLGFAATAALIGLALWLPIPKSFPHAVIPMLAAWATWGSPSGCRVLPLRPDGRRGRPRRRPGPPPRLGSSVASSSLGSWLSPLCQGGSQGLRSVITIAPSSFRAAATLTARSVITTQQSHERERSSRRTTTGPWPTRRRGS